MTPIQKLYEITIAYEDDGGYSSHCRRINVLAEDALKAVEKIKLEKYEIVDEIRNLGVVEIE